MRDVGNRSAHPRAGTHRWSPLESTDPHLSAGVREGEILAGKYRIDRVLGVGGMGAVVAARHLQLDTKVAIKFLLPAMLANREAVSRFAREAQAAVKITSEHVARVFDVGTLGNGAPYMVMEYLEGGDLAAWLQQRGPMPIEQAVEFVLQACVAVADAHGLGIVHRDLKPANLFCIRRSDGQFLIKVLDFGISKSAESSGMSVTSTSAVLGSPLYMSPEQMQSPKGVDTATDIWALGIVLFELLSGRVPFEGETFGELAVKVATQPAPPIRRFRPDVPPNLDAAIRKCLQPDRRNRHRNVADLAVALLPFAPRRGRASVERISGILQSTGLTPSDANLPPSPTVPPTLATPGTVAPVGRTAPGVTLPGRSGRAAVVAGLLGAVAVVGTVGTVAFERTRRGPVHTGELAVASSPGASPAVDVPKVATAQPLAEVQAAAPPTAPTTEPPTVKGDEPASAPSAPDPSRASHNAKPSPAPMLRPRTPGPPVADPAAPAQPTPSPTGSKPYNPLFDLKPK
jgi:eukaryotic-like serine/threonine-protein kinase